MNARSLLRHAWTLGALLLVSLGGNALVTTVARAQGTYPTECRPSTGATLDCTNVVTSPYLYLNSGCSTPGQLRISESQSQSLWESEFLAGITQCPGYTYDRTGWIPPGSPMCQSGPCGGGGLPIFSVACGGTPIEFPILQAGKDRSNWLIYQIGHPASPAPPACTANQPTIPWGTIRRDRNMICPRGYISAVMANGGSVCRRTNLDVAKNLGSQCPSCGNPISPGSGNKTQVELDYEGTGSFPLRFVRTYNSLMRLDNRHGGYYGFSSVFDIAGNAGFNQLAFGQVDNPHWMNLGLDSVGANWRHNYQRSINYETAGPNGINTASAYRPDGRVFAFNNFNGTFVPQSDVSDRLTRLTDGSGNTTGWQYVSADNDELETYGATGRLLSIRNRAGVTQTLEYDSAGRLTRVSDPIGHAMTFAYGAVPSDPAAIYRIVSMTDPAGNTYQYGYGASSTLGTVTYPGNRIRQYLYENAAFPRGLTGIIDENQIRYATFGYNAVGLASLSEHAGGAGRVTVTNDASTDFSLDLSVTVTDAKNVTRTYAYSNVLGVARNTGITQPAASGSGTRTATTGYDANGNVNSRTDFNGVETRYVFDLARNLETSRTEAFGTPRARTITTQWHANFRLPTQIDEPNRRTSFTHDAAGNVLTRMITDLATSQTRTWTFTYNAVGQVLTENGPRLDVTDVTTYTYYSCTTGSQCGRVQTMTNAVGHVTTYNTYDANGRATQITDPNGLVTTLAYNFRGQVTSQTVGNEATSFLYDNAGQLTRVTLPDASFIEYLYDDAHRLTQIRDGTGNRIVYTLDAMGNRAAENTFDPSNALSRTHSRVYNALDRLTQEIGAANQTTVNTYDDNGNLDTVTDPRNRLTNHDYDELNRLTRITDPALGVTQFGYDANDNFTSVTDPRTLATGYTFNGFGDLTQLTSPDTGLTQYTPDAAGNVDLMIDARNRSGDYQYDALNRASQIVYADQTVAFEYDQSANALGRLTRVTDASGNTQWTYNAQGRVATKQQTIGTLARTVSYGYNSAGQLTQVTTPSGQTLGYGYTNNRVTSVTVNGATLLSQVLYEPFGPTRGWGWANGTLTVRDYDTDWQLTLLDSAGLSTFAFFPDGLIQTRTDDAPTTFGLPTGTTNYTPATLSNRLASSTGTQTRTYGFDAAGNTTSYTGATFTYNDAGRMISSMAGGVTTSYLVNGLGQRVRKSNAALTRLFVYDESGHLLGEYDQTGALIQETVWLEDIPVATLRPSGGSLAIFYVHTDHLNTPRKISRPSDNAILWRWESDPFGQAAANEDADGDGQAFSYNLRFPGQYFDAETGLSYNYFRDYDPQIGRYVESDPIGIEGGLNTYLYADADAISKMDPTGENPAAAVRGAWWIGTRIGTGIGISVEAVTKTTIGVLVWEMCHESEQEREERCEENLKRDMATCKKGSRRYGSDWFRVCEQQAMARYSNCLSGRDEGIDAPLPPWGKL